MKPTAFTASNPRPYAVCRGDESCGICGGQGKRAEQVEFSARVGGWCLLAAVLLVVVAALAA
jgi:hypothetical protein